FYILENKYTYEVINAIGKRWIVSHVEGETDPEKISEKSPAYLSNILEQDFYGGGDTKGKNIKGMTIGVAMNSVYYYKKEKDGSTFSKNLDDSEVKKQGKHMTDVFETTASELGGKAVVTVEQSYPGFKIN
ncbi:CamS family sex pheromone protein, partial [Staphylococcus aureus]|uniref:CamS family sex pheromone protein n=1 Tax=Staphylococcus aureus TaxID=1280 RepID=UPI00210A7E3A